MGPIDLDTFAVIFDNNSYNSCLKWGFKELWTIKTGKNRSAEVQDVPYHGSNCNWNGIFASRKSSNPIHGSYGSEDGAALPLDVGMALAHQPMDQILIFLAQMIHSSWETPLIIPDFEIFKICGFWAHSTVWILASSPHHRQL